MTEPQTDRPSDEEILRFEREIKNKEFENKPLVSDMVDISVLEVEYEGAPVFLSKIQELKNKRGIRMIRKDGNCFYRAFAFAFCNLVQMNRGSPWESFIRAKIENTKSILTSTGYDMSIMDDFMEPFLEAVDSDGNLEVTFNIEYTSDTIVCFLRILTAAFLKKEREMYEGFVLDSYPSLDAFLGACVEPMNIESDEIHIVAIANALNINVKVYHLDNSEGNLNIHDIAPMNDEFPGAPSVDLLYRPGHYDIIC